MGIQTSDCLRIEDWSVFICLGWDALERAFVGRADLYLNDGYKCRIELTGDVETANEAADFLKSKTSSFIDDWSRREHSVECEFCEL